MRIALLFSSLIPALSLLAGGVTPENAAQLSSRNTELPVELAQLAPTTGLPDLLTFKDGRKVGDLVDRNKRRGELIPPLFFISMTACLPGPTEALFREIRSYAWFQGNNWQATGRLYHNSSIELGNPGFRVARPLTIAR